MRALLPAVHSRNVVPCKPRGKLGTRCNARKTIIAKRNDPKLEEGVSKSPQDSLANAATKEMLGLSRLLL